MPKKGQTPAEGVRAFAMAKFGDSVVLRIEDAAIRDAAKDVDTGVAARCRPDTTVYGTAYHEAFEEFKKLFRTK